jgi:hypothetical protein
VNLLEPICARLEGEPPVPLSKVEVKALARHRDGYRCTSCGMSAVEHVRRYGKNLDVHRIVPGSKYSLSGCVTLCRKCHGPQPRRERGHRINSGDGEPVKLLMKLSRHVADWLGAYVEATRPRPTKRAVVEDALENYFRQKGFPHPDEAP